MDSKVRPQVALRGGGMEKDRVTVIGDATSPFFVELIPSLEQRGFKVATLASVEDLIVRRGTLNSIVEIVFLIASEPSPQFFESLSKLHQHSQMTIVMVSDDITNDTIERATHSGAHAYLAEIPSGRRLDTVISAAVARSKIIKSMNRELHDVKQTLHERKIVERAKGILMHRKALDEATAYRAMQKMAMNRNVKLIELAQSMITASELLDETN